MFQAAPPPPPPPPEIVRTESSYLQVSRKDVPLSLVKDKRTENALIRYQLFVRTDVEARQAQAVPDAPPPPVFCQWVVSVYLEREPCFESISGKLACADRYTVRLQDQSRGSETLPLTAEATACAVGKPEIAAASALLAAAGEAAADAHFGADLTKRLTPELAKGGIKATIRAVR
ncbi:MAG: hypothetical protein KKE02_00170 [Alphaproteobacteria bacterium]|nr:hypothetical protein [Alphaproteobacteria bacterium]MBU1514860.1 hypothetical protein [Alphaproteobacteria bacterium]MBU2093781.1 hypothetical protein [Alphaproteobacteria bacterium]MBU2149402.1 hypothetical protein [Alphaproteobacteria bacterium]MBU2305362.1 hypothetical protein [Alphaproteobacteria bacterium]